MLGFMVARPTPQALAVAEALRHLDIDVDIDGGFVRIVRTGERIAVEADEPAPALTTGQIVVRDRVTRAAAHQFRSAGIGWLDLSGRLSYRSPGLVIEADVPGALAPTSQRRSSVLAGNVVAGVTIASLVSWPEPLKGVRATARELDVTAGGVSAATRRLIDAGYMTADRRATSALFWAAADEWRPRWVDLPVEGIVSGSEGVVAVGALAAAQLGAPVAVTASTAPEYLVADSAMLKYALLAAQSRSASDMGGQTARYAVAPAPIAARLLQPGSLSVLAVPVASAAVVALSLALDPGRGAETVRAWGGEHVWI